MSETEGSQDGPGKFDYASRIESPLPSDIGLRLARHTRRLSGVYVDHSQDEVHSAELFDTLQRPERRPLWYTTVQPTRVHSTIAVECPNDQSCPLTRASPE